MTRARAPHSDMGRPYETSALLVSGPHHLLSDVSGPSFPLVPLPLRGSATDVPRPSHTRILIMVYALGAGPP